MKVAVVIIIIIIIPLSIDESTRCTQHDGAIGLRVSNVGRWWWCQNSLSSLVTPPVAMPTFPKRLVIARAAMVFLLCNSFHVGSLYSADNIGNALSIVADVEGNSSTSMKVNEAMLLCAFANTAEDEFLLVYSEHFCCYQERNVIYVRKTTKPGRHGEKSVAFGCFFVNWCSKARWCRTVAHHLGWIGLYWAGVISWGSVIAEAIETKMHCVWRLSRQKWETSVAAAVGLNSVTQKKQSRTTNDILHVGLEGGEDGTIFQWPYYCHKALVNSVAMY